MTNKTFCENAINLPRELDAFLCTLLTESTEITTEYSHRDRRLVNSFGQDIYGANAATVRSKNFDKRC